MVVKAPLVVVLAPRVDGWWCDGIISGGIGLSESAFGNVVSGHVFKNAIYAEG